MSRDNKGRFRKGASGNPNGRPKRSDELRQLLEGGADEVAKVVMEAAKGGDLQAAKLVMERCVPVARATMPSVQFELDTENPSNAGRSILKAIATGELAPDVGKQLLDGCSALAKIDEIDEIVRRLDALEAVKHEA